MPTRKEQKDALRQERLEQQQRAQAGARRKRIVGLGAAAVLAVAAVVAIAVVALSGGDENGGGGGGSALYPGGGKLPAVQETELSAAAKAAGCTITDEEAEGNDHVEGKVTYKANPPHSGDHNIEPVEEQLFEETPQTENWVHSLEHGRLVIQFKKEIPSEARANLKVFYDMDPFHMMVMPNTTKMPFELAATVWTRDPEPRGTGHLLGCPKINDRVYDALAAFRTRFRDNDIPPENVP